MSFILDALKKSETERQQQNTPGIASIPHRGKDQAPSKWLWLALGLLVINLAVVAGIFLWPEAQTDETVSIAVEPQNESTSFSDMVSEAKRVQPAVAETEVVVSSEQAPPEPVGAPSISRPTPGLVSDPFESFNDLRAKGEITLPDLHLDVHVFAGTPADRFVFVNTVKYKENAVLSEGPRVVEITPEGVLLEHQNKTFLLPRQ